MSFAGEAEGCNRCLWRGELLARFVGRSRWSDVMRLRGDTEIHGTAAAPLGAQVRRLRLRHGAELWLPSLAALADGKQTVNLPLAHPTGLSVEEP